MYIVCYTMLVQRFELQGRRVTNLHYYYDYQKQWLLNAELLMWRGEAGFTKALHYNRF